MDLKKLGKLNLARGLRLLSEAIYPNYRNLRLALTGAGGKTSALFQLAHQLPPPVLVSASTHLATSQLAMADRHFFVHSTEELTAIQSKIFDGVVLLTGPEGGDGRTLGLSGEILDLLNDLAGYQGIPVLIEADGARTLPLKAPAGHEPAIPSFSNFVVVVAGMSGLGSQLDSASVHRPEIFSALSGLEIGARVDEKALVRVLLHLHGGLKGVPAGARRSVLLNQVDSLEQVEKAANMAEMLLVGYHSVLVASLGRSIPVVHTVHEKKAGIVLAAGGSSRLGSPKQLLKWQGIPLVRHVAERALQAGLSPVIVVTGAHAGDIEQALRGLDVKIAHNPDWELGQSTSVGTGLQALPSNIGAAVFLLSDQPQVTKKLLDELSLAHTHSLASIVAPRVHGKRANPVLFDRIVFPELLALEGDTGGRVLFSDDSRFTVEWVDWDDASLLLDVDTPGDYQRLLGLELKS
jgi:molybdenum cofactor cytidylyltransferase